MNEKFLKPISEQLEGLSQREKNEIIRLHRLKVLFEKAGHYSLVQEQVFVPIPIVEEVEGDEETAVEISAFGFNQRGGHMPYHEVAGMLKRKKIGVEVAIERCLREVDYFKNVPELNVDSLGVLGEPITEDDYKDLARVVDDDMGKLTISVGRNNFSK